MTRINVVPAEELTDLHLLAEYRELPRIFALAKKAFERNDMKGIPEKYTLGKGHVRFFYNKLFWLKERQKTLVLEMKKRGMNPKFDNPDELIEDIPDELLGDLEITDEALMINRARIFDRLNGKKD